MNALDIGTEQDFKTHNDLPLARIKRIMKSDEDVRMISAEAPVLFAKACEMFILELTLRCAVLEGKGGRGVSPAGSTGAQFWSLAGSGVFISLNRDNLLCVRGTGKPRRR